MAWLIALLIAVAVLLVLWRVGKLDRATLQLTAAALLLAMAGYAWQGRPDLSGNPVTPPKHEKLPDSAFAETRTKMLGQFDNAASWLTIAEAFQREGDTQNGVNVIRAGLKAHPNDPDLWVGLGNALVIHADGLMTPSAELAFQRAERIAPDHPGPKFFYGLALAQGGKFEEAEAIWQNILQTAPPEASWRPMIEERIAMVRQARLMGGVPAPAGAQSRQ